MRGVWTWALTGLAPWLSPAAAAAQERGYEWGWGMHPMWGVWGLGIGLMMLLFWGVVIVGSVLAIRWLVSQGRPPQSDRALDRQQHSSR